MNLQGIENVLIIAPHADDETLGCGGTIKKLSKLGKQVYVLILTNAHIGEPKLFSIKFIDKVRKEALGAHKISGVKETLFADFPAPRLDTFPVYKMANHILEIINQKKIDTIFTCHRGDVHLDHRRVFEASLVAARPQGDYSVKRIYTYETLSETEWAPPFPEDNFIPNIFIDISSELRSKISAFECFKSQLKKFPHPRSSKGIEVLANHRGSIISVEAAEAFSLIREVL